MSKTGYSDAKFSSTGSLGVDDIETDVSNMVINMATLTGTTKWSENKNLAGMSWS